MEEKEQKSMEKIHFQSNDIVKLSKIKFESLSKELFFPQNLFVIKEVNQDEVGIALKNVNYFFTFEDILPVKIDGKEDRDIYYDPIVAASIVTEGEEIPLVQRDTSEYYMNSLKKSYNEDSVSYYNLIHNMGIKYVHEIQHEFPSLQCDLKIHYHIREFVNKSNVLGRLGRFEKIITAKEYIDNFIEKMTEDEKSFVFLRKDIDEKNQIASLIDKQKFDYVIICSKAEMAKYYAFFINSVIGKLFLLPDFKTNRLRGRTKISQIKRLPIYYIEEYATDCIVLQTLMEYLQTYNRSIDSVGDDTFSTIFSYFSSLRDSMVLEMVLPKLFEKANISILKLWNDEIVRLAVKNQGDTTSEQKDGLDVLCTLFEDLMTSGNELMENMNRLRLYMKEFMDFATKKMAEEK